MQIGGQFAARNYVQAAGGSLEVEIGGAAAGEYDVLNVMGQATLVGTLAVQFVNDYTPTVGDTFAVLTCGSRVGTFATIQAPDGVELTASYTSTGVTLEVASVDVSTPGDFDGDGDVDLSDFSTFSLCFAGANNPPAASCPPGVDADFDDDGDIDLSDFSTFSLNFTGPL